MSLCVLHASTRQQGLCACIPSDRHSTSAFTPDAGLAHEMADALMCGRASRVVAVVGAGHVPGMFLAILQHLHAKSGSA